MATIRSDFVLQPFPLHALISSFCLQKFKPCRPSRGVQDSGTSADFYCRSKLYGELTEQRAEQFWYRWHRKDCCSVATERFQGRSDSGVKPAQYCLTSSMSWFQHSCCGRPRKQEGRQLDVRVMENENGDLQALALTKEASSQPSLNSDVDELNYAIEIAELEQILGRVSIFGTLSALELTSLARALTPICASDGEHIYRQGELAETFFVILSGAVQKVVEGGDPSKPSIPISQPLTAGAYFGQTALVVPGGKRSCSMRAIGDTDLRVISRAQFQKEVGDLKELLRRNPSLYQKYRTYFSNKQ